MIADLLEQARAARETVTLYQQEILPLARKTLEADQRAYGQDAQVEFDRVIGDFRNVINSEAGHYRALGGLLTALARLEQAVGLPLEAAACETEKSGETDDEPRSGP